MEHKTDIAATRIDNRKIEAVLRLQRLTDCRDALSQMDTDILRMSNNETDTDLSMALEMLRLETYRLAMRYNSEVTRLSFMASIIDVESGDWLRPGDILGE